MILPFSTQLNGKPTYFVEKIHKGVRSVLNIGVPFKTKDFSYQAYCDSSPKLHTIREDKNNRWKPGIMIDFFINARQKNMFRFAPRIPVVSTQEIFMTRRGMLLEISISKVDSYIGGDDFQLTYNQIEKLALNDGFDNYNDFSNYFMMAIESNGLNTGNYWFKGKIIHWTDKHY